MKQVLSASHAEPSCTTEELWGAVNKFAAWLEKSGYATYDPYDVWGNAYGRLARRLYYEKNAVGGLMTAPLLLMEIGAPGLRALFVKKDRYPTADAQLALAFLNLYEACLDRKSKSSDDKQKSGWERSAAEWMTKAKGLADDLLAESAPGYKGYCWGYPFDWQNVNGLMCKNTPHITATPYCYEVFTKLFDLTGGARCLDVARSIMEFVSEDLRDTPTGEDSAASSYTPNDNGKVVNASAYRAFLLFDAAHRFHNDAYRVKAWKNLRFILQSQRPDGSWLYAIDNPKEAFIDNFHTCFVLKNLYKLNRIIRSTTVQDALRRGYEWYRQALFDDQNNPKSFAIAPRLQIVQLEMYNLAEAITLGVLLTDEIPDALELADTLAARLMRKYQLPAGHWPTRTYFGGIRHTTPFLRWPQAQLFFALTNRLLAAERSEPDNRSTIDHARMSATIS